MLIKLGVQLMRIALDRKYIGGKLDSEGVTFKFTPEMKNRIHIEAKALGVSEADLVREIIAVYLVESDLRFEDSLKARGLSSKQLETLVDQQKISPLAGTSEPVCSIT